MQGLLQLEVFKLRLVGRGNLNAARPALHWQPHQGLLQQSKRIMWHVQASATKHQRSCHDASLCLMRICKQHSIRTHLLTTCN